MALPFRVKAAHKCQCLHSVTQTASQFISRRTGVHLAVGSPLNWLKSTATSRRLASGSRCSTGSTPAQHSSYAYRLHPHTQDNPLVSPIYLHSCYNCPATGGIRFERPGSGWIRQLLRFDALASHPVLGQTEKRAAESAVRSQRLAPSCIVEPSIYLLDGFCRNPHAGVVGQDWSGDQQGWS